MGKPTYNYLDSFQVSLTVIVIVAIGYFCGWRKTFTSVTAAYFRRTLYLICIPGLIFRQISIHSLTLSTWNPLFISLLVQATVHILVGLICLIFPFEKKGKMFMEIICATSFADFIYYSCPLMQFVYDADHQFIPIIQSLVHFFVQVPVYTVLSYYFQKVDKDDEDNLDALSHSDSLNSRPKQAFNEQLGNSFNEEEMELEGGIENGPTKPINQIENIDNPEEEQNTKDDNNSNGDQEELIQLRPEHDNEESQEHANTPQEDNGNNEESENHDKPMSLGWSVFWNYVNPITICTVLGIIWSAVDIENIFVVETTKALQNAVFGAGLFVTGVIMYDYPFIKFKIGRVICYLVIHYIVIPFIAVLWNYVLKVDQTTAIISSLSFVVPVNLFGPAVASNTGYKMKSVSYTLFWSNIIFLPIFMAWIAFFKEVSVFK